MRGRGDLCGEMTQPALGSQRAPPSARLCPKVTQSRAGFVPLGSGPAARRAEPPRPLPCHGGSDPGAGGTWDPSTHPLPRCAFPEPETLFLKVLPQDLGAQAHSSAGEGDRQADRLMTSGSVSMQNGVGAHKADQAGGPIPEPAGHSGCGWTSSPSFLWLPAVPDGRRPAGGGKYPAGETGPLGCHQGEGNKASGEHRVPKHLSEQGQ